MAQELVLLSKERFDTLSKQMQNKDCGVNRTTPSTPSDGESIEPLVRKSSSRFILPDTLSKRVVGLYSFMTNQNKSVLDHNDMGEVIVNGQTIRGSNIVKIIRHITSTRKTKTTPTGTVDVQRVMKKLKIPPGLLLPERKTAQNGGMFVRREGKRDMIPGKAKMKIDWMKY